jgi:transposase
MTVQIHEELQARDLLPGKHLADTGYVDPELLVTSREEFGLDLIGPTRPDYKWQAKAGTGFARSDFTTDWDRQQATCPDVHASTGWTPAVDRGQNEVIKIKFSAKDRGLCPSRAPCTRGKRRTITVRPHEQYLALQAARERESSEEFKREYSRRVGIEGTISQGVRACGLRRTRYVGEAKVHLQRLATAAAINLLRIGDWLMDRPREQTRTSAYTRLMRLPAAA